MSSYICKKTEAACYSFRRIGPFSAWADITLRQWPEGGAIHILSDYGSFGAHWINIGCKDFREFLVSLRMDYFFGKCGYDFREFDCAASVRCIRQGILRGRRRTDLDRDAAREVWDTLFGIDTCASSWAEVEAQVGPAAFDRMVEILYEHDYSMLPDVRVPRSEAVGFWDEVWPCACKVWREELDSNNSLNK